MEGSNSGFKSCNSRLKQVLLSFVAARELGPQSADVFAHSLATRNRSHKHRILHQPRHTSATLLETGSSSVDETPGEEEPRPWERTIERHAHVKHTLRICNAYPYNKPMNIELNEVELYGGMEYKECDDFVNLNLEPGDQLRFKTEVDYHQHSAGIFEIADLPHYSSTLLLVISRHDKISNAVQFESHVFRNSENAQVAVVDTFKGANKARIQIMDAGGEVGTHGGPEPLPFGSVHRINTGLYEIAMDESYGRHDNIVKKLVALPMHNYVVLRMGIEDDPEAEDGPQEGPNPIPGDKSYPEQLIVFPLSDASRLKGAATPARGSVSIVGLALITVMASRYWFL